MGRMALVATAVQPAHIGDGRAWPLGLDLQRRNQSILGLDHDPVASTLRFDADSELRLHGSPFLFGDLQPSQNGAVSHQRFMSHPQEYLLEPR